MMVLSVYKFLLLSQRQMKQALCANIPTAIEVDLVNHIRICKLIYISVLFECCLLWLCVFAFVVLVNLV